ncbi:MAG: hypothetical protein WCC59_03980, partial [Terriglobales bacterium]
IKAVYSPGGVIPNFVSNNWSVAATTAASITTAIIPGTPTSTTASVSYPGSGTLSLASAKCEVRSAVTLPPASMPSCEVAALPATLSKPGDTANLTINIVTTTVSASIRPSGDPAGARFASLCVAWVGVPAFVFLGLGLPVGTIRRKSLRRKALGWLGLMLVLSILLAGVACGGGNFTNPGNNKPIAVANASTPGNYTAVVSYTDSQNKTQALATVDFSVGQ